MAGPWEKYGQPAVQTKPADPTMPYKGPAAAADLQATNLGNALKAQELAKPQVLGDSGYMLDPKTKRAVPIPGYVRPGPQMTAEQQAADRAKLTSLRALENQIRTVAELYRKGPGATSGVAGLLDYLPLASNKAFDTASAGIGDVAFNAFRTVGAGAQSDAELRARLAATQPDSSDYNEEVEQKLGYLQNRLAEEYKARGIRYNPVLIGALKKPKPGKADDGWKIEEVR